MVDESGGGARLPLPLGEGVGGRGPRRVDKSVGWAATTVPRPLLPTPSRKGRGGALNAAPMALALVVAGCVLSAAAALRSFEYDEGYSVFVTSGVPRPA